MWGKQNPYCPLRDLFVNKAVYKRISAPITIEELISFLKTHLLHEVSDWIGSSGGKH